MHYGRESEIGVCFVRASCREAMGKCDPLDGWKVS